MSVSDEPLFPYFMQSKVLLDLEFLHNVPSKLSKSSHGRQSDSTLRPNTRFSNDDNGV